jgi:two-component system, LytTR family, response regulator
MQAYKTIVVENDPAFLESFRLQLDNFPAVELLAACEGIDDAHQAIRQHKPDLVFLDIEINGGTAFDLLSRFDAIDFEIVFTTAYDEYALRAIELSALHYLLKPFGRDELAEALRRMNQKKQSEVLVRNLLANLARENDTNFRIALKTSESIELIPLGEILYCQADNNYTVFHLNNGQKLMVSNTIKKFDEMLSDRNFLRVHQSYLVNLLHVRKLLRADGGSLVMSNGDLLPVARRKRDELQRAIEQTSLG